MNLNNLLVINPFKPIQKKGLKTPLTDIFDIYQNTKNKSFVKCIKLKYQDFDNFKVLTHDNIVDWFNINLVEFLGELDLENNFDFDFPVFEFELPIDVIIFLFFTVENKHRLNKQQYHKELEIYCDNIHSNLGLKWRNVGHQIEMYTKYN